MAETDLTPRWHAYYTEKRMVHQWMQVHLMADLPVRRVLEIGPHLGLVTAMLASAGYAVVTLDVELVGPKVGATGHIVADIRCVRPDQIRGFDAILCCETLEHVVWDEVDQVLRAFAASGAPWLVISVPYEELQFGLTLYVNRHVARRRSFFRKLRFLKRYPCPDTQDFGTHKWEVGYKGNSLPALKQKLVAGGWKPIRQEFTADCRSVFLVAANNTVTG